MTYYAAVRKDEAHKFDPEVLKLIEHKICQAQPNMAVSAFLYLYLLLFSTKCDWPACFVS